VNLGIFPGDPYQGRTLGQTHSFGVRGYADEGLQGTPGVTRCSVLGLDLGQSRDPAAGVLGIRERMEEGYVGAPDPHVRIRYMRQWLGESYWAIAEATLDLNPDVMVVDYGGVGRAVVDILRQLAVMRGYTGRIIPLATVDSRASNERMHEDERGRYVTVPKVSLLTPINILSQGPERLAVDGDGAYILNGEGRPSVHRDSFLVFPSPAEEELVDLLKRQLNAFEVRHGSNGSTAFGNNRKLEDHDDLVIALGLMCWGMLRMGGKDPAIVV